MSGKRWISAVRPSAASDPARDGARSAAISWDLLKTATRCSSAFSTGLVDRQRLPARGETPRSGSSAHAGLHRRAWPAWTETGLTVTRRRLPVTKRRLSASRRQYVARTRAQPPAETSQQRITRGLFPRSYSMTCTDSTANGSGGPDRTGISRPAVPRRVPRTMGTPAT